MVREREPFSDKCSRITGTKICNPNFQKEFVTLDHSCSSGQQSCSGISPEDGWYPQSTAFQKPATQLGIICCLIRSRLLQVECQGRLVVQECNSLNWKSESVSENNQTFRNPNSRSFCLQAVPPTSPIYGMEARSKQFCSRCNAAGLEKNVCCCIRTF